MTATLSDARPRSFFDSCFSCRGNGYPKSHPKGHPKRNPTLVEKITPGGISSSGYCQESDTQQNILNRAHSISPSCNGESLVACIQAHVYRYELQFLPLTCCLYDIKIENLRHLTAPNENPPYYHQHSFITLLDHCLPALNLSNPLFSLWSPPMLCPAITTRASPGNNTRTAILETDK